VLRTSNRHGFLAVHVLGLEGPLVVASFEIAMVDVDELNAFVHVSRRIPGEAS